MGPSYLETMGLELRAHCRGLSGIAIMAKRQQPGSQILVASEPFQKRPAGLGGQGRLATAISKAGATDWGEGREKTQPPPKTSRF